MTLRSPLSFRLAKRLRKGRLNNRFVFLISWLSLLSIAIGIAALVIGLSAMNGFERELRDRILTFVPDAEIFSARNEPLSDWRALQAQLLKNPQIKSVTPEVQFAGLLEKKGRLRATQIQAIEVEDSPSSLIDAQDWSQFKSQPNRILIGDGLAKKLDLKTGDSVTLLFSPPEDHEFKQPQKRRFIVAGTIHFNGELGNYFSFIPLETAQSLLDLGQNITALSLKIDDPFQINRFIQDLKVDFKTPLKVKTWMSQENGKYFNIYKDIQMIRVIMYIAMIVVIMVACFSIVSSLVIAVKDKQKEIAILKTMGASNGLIYRIFMFYGLISGALGATLGLVLGVFITLNLTRFFQFIEGKTGTKLLNSEIYFIDFVPTQIEIKDLVIVFVLTLLISFLSSLYPAWRAAKINPVLLLKN